ncbi:hypothetical protein AB6A40_001463 [Gnathostoma spinigerum]|uniref:Uncharacterized protein n=1 Tax=Gnathostoma spinigerum TaxID=75299 RepID=A0ABD6E9C9_9BILA
MVTKKKSNKKDEEVVNRTAERMVIIVGSMNCVSDDEREGYQSERKGTRICVGKTIAEQETLVNQQMIEYCNKRRQQSKAKAYRSDERRIRNRNNEKKTTDERMKQFV